MYTVSILLALVFVGLLVLHYRRRSRREMSFRALFEPGRHFIEKDFHYAVNHTGPSTFFGDMDHGREVAPWEVGRLLAEAWFQKWHLHGSRGSFKDEIESHVIIGVDNKSCSASQCRVPGSAR